MPSRFRQSFLSLIIAIRKGIATLHHCRIERSGADRTDSQQAAVLVTFVALTRHFHAGNQSFQFPPGLFTTIPCLTVPLAGLASFWSVNANQSDFFI